MSSSSPLAGHSDAGRVRLALPTKRQPTPLWMQRWLWVAAAYNVAFGAWVVLFPNSYFEWLGMTPPNYPQLWQCIGMIVGVYGLGYFVAGFAPMLHWPIVLVGFLGKIFGPLGFLQAIVMGTLPLSFGWILLTNDLLWWIPFYGILAAAWRYYANQTEGMPTTITPEAALSAATTNTGENLMDMIYANPVLLVCLRHFGCTFCREMVDDLMALQPMLPVDARIVFVTTGSAEQADTFFVNVQNAAWISDPQRILYRALGLKRGTFAQVFGLSVWVRGVMAGVIKGYGVGTLQGDGFQMPGLFWFNRPASSTGTFAIQGRWLAQNASDRVTPHVIEALLKETTVQSMNTGGFKT
jgi:hypothetical protein